MIDNLSNFLFKVSMTIFFIIGVTLFLFSQREISELIDLAEDSYLQSSSVVLKDKDTEENYSLGHEIITQKMSFRQLPIVVEGVTIETKDDLLSVNARKMYYKNTVFDAVGQLEYIEYKEK